MRVLANSCISDSPKTTFVIKIDTACARLIRKLHKHYGKYCRRFPVQCKEMQINRDFPLSLLSLTKASFRKGEYHRITSLRSVFLFPTTGYLTKERKSTSGWSRTPFFVHQRPLRERALDGPLAHKKSATSWLRFCVLS